MDWSARLLPEDAARLRALPFAALARVPPPKRGGLPWGHELRILARALRGRSSSLDPSALTRLYAAALRPDEARLWRGLVAREALPASEWVELLGAELLEGWRRRGLLVEEPGALRSRLAMVSLGGLRFAVDPQEQSFRHKVHIGQDSLHLLELVRARADGRAGRQLDVGTGSGIQLLALGPAAEESLGIDINPRAVRVAGFNAELNRRSDCRFAECDALDPATRLGRFDRILWNAPFMFYPEEERSESVDGDGGDLGTEVTLAFTERLPELLRDGGTAWVMSAAPVMVSGENRLEAELGLRAEALGLAVTGFVLQSFWVPRLRGFHARFGIERFESVILELRRGRGGYLRRAPPLTRRVLDRARGWALRLRWAGAQ